MKRSAVISGLVVCAGCAGQSAVQPVSYFFDCDTAAARSSAWSRTVDHRAAGFSGTMEFVEIREHEQWSPAATILLNGPTATEFTGFRVLRSPSSQGELRVSFIGERSLESEEDLGPIASSTSPIPFEIRYEDGKATYRLGGMVKVVDTLRFAVDKASLGCSTAEVKFDGVQVR